MNPDRAVSRFARRVNYSPEQHLAFAEGGHRVRHVRRLSKVVTRFSIQVEIVRSENCNSGHTVGQQLHLDLDGNLITKLCPGKVCVYLVSQLALPVALINERLSEGLAPNDFHFMRTVRCPDAGVDCLGYGEVAARVQVVPRKRSPATEPAR